MFPVIYIEDEIAEHPRTRSILARFPDVPVVTCERYTQIFNRKNQNFRIQKNNPALILARKHQNQILSAPSGYGFGAEANYYFSHMLNCLYDCRYCFLQGMLRSAFYVLFVNYEDFQQAIDKRCRNASGPVWFFSGYDCDSLAMEPVTGFADEFLHFFEKRPNAWLELRTKSTQVRSLLTRDPLPNVVVAFSLSPQNVIDAYEARTPALHKRLAAIHSLQQRGWKIGLRFDPIIYFDDYETSYDQFFKEVFEVLDPTQIHSVSLGSFRVPDSYFKKMVKLYPDSRLFSGPLVSTKGMTGYPQDLDQTVLSFCKDRILDHVSQKQFYPCVVTGQAVA